MKKVASALLVATAALALAAAAQAKGGEIRAVCGTSGCAQVVGSGEIEAWTDESTSFTQPAPYYVVQLTYGDAYWLPQTGWFAVMEDVSQCSYNDCWLRPGPEAQAFLRDQAAGLEPFRPELRKVTVAGKAVADPDAFLELFGKLPWATLPREKLRLTRIMVWPSRPNPWIVGASYLGYDARHRILVRSDGNFRFSRARWAALLGRASIAGRLATA
jgi:hypothetical protein